MKLVALHTDFRIYWPARWKYLAKELERQGKGSLEVIELFGKGSPYAFNGETEVKSMKWHVLFPEDSPEEKSGKEIKPELFALLDRINPDVIICGAIAFPSGALAVQWALRHRDKRVVCFDDAKIGAVKRNGIVNFVKQNVYNGVDAMFYPAEPWRETGHYWGFNDSQMVFGVDVVDNEFWSKPAGSPLVPPPYFLAVGRQIAKKNFYGAVKAYQAYARNVGIENALPFVLVGDGPEHKRIIKEITKDSIENKIICLPFLSQDKVRNLMQHALLLLLSSEAETWGLVINEAMNCGCAIISTLQCGATDVLVKDGFNGYHTSYNDIPATTDALIRYHNLSNAEKEAFAKASKEIISHWGLDKFAKSAIQAAEYTLSHPKRKPNILGRLIINLWNGQYNPI